MCTVSAPPLFGSLVNLYVLDDEISGIKTLGVCIRLGILEQGEEKFSRFDRPASLGDTELLSLCTPSRAPGIPSHRHRLLMPNHILKVRHSALQFPSIDCLRSLAGILEADTKIGAAGPGALSTWDRLCCVTDHLEEAVVMKDGPEDELIVFKMSR